MCYVHTTPLTCTSGNKQSATETAILAAILLECQVVCHELQFMAYNFSAFAFTAMTLLVGWQEGDTACKNWVVRYWHGYLSVARCKWFAYGPADVTATASFFCASKIQNGLPFWCWLTQESWKKGHSMDVVLYPMNCKTMIQQAVNSHIHLRIHVSQVDY